MLDPYVGDLHVGFPMQLQIKWNGTFYDITHFVKESEAKEPRCYSPENPHGGHSLISCLQDKHHPVSGHKNRDDGHHAFRAAIAEYMVFAVNSVLKAEPNLFEIHPDELANGILDMSFFYGSIVPNGPSSDAMPVISRVMALAKPDTIDFDAGPLSCRLSPMTDEPHFFAALTSP